MIVNDRDTLLQAAPQRFSTANTGIVLSGVSTIRTAADGSSPNPASVTLNAVLLGVSGTLSWSVTGGALSGTDNTSRTLAASSMTGDVATVTVSLTYAGAPYTAKFSVAKVRDGSAGGAGQAGSDGLQTAVARLYQWSTVAPAKPIGTSTLTWASASNGSYTGTDGWGIAVPANPGTPGARLYVASVSVAATAKATTSGVGYGAAAVEAWAQNGANGATGATGASGSNGANGIQSGAATVYQWAATIPAGPVGSASLKWSDGSFGAAPTNWTLTPGTSPSAGMTLFAARVQVTDSAVATTTAFNWSTAAIMAIGYAGSNGANGANGAAGQAGASYVTAYCASATGSATSAPAATTGKSSLPAANSGGISGTWSATVPTLAAGQYMYQSDGIYDPATDKITWSIPYWSSLKVATLSAITANLGAINAGSINLGGGTFTVDNDGNLVCRSIKILNPDGSVMLQAGGKLNPANAAPGTMNSEIRVGGRNFLRDSQRIVDLPNNTGTGTSALRTDEAVPYYRITAPNGVSTFTGLYALPGVAAGTVCTLSSDVRIGAPGSVGHYAGAAMVSVLAANQWTRISQSFTYDGTGVRLGHTFSGTSLDYRNYKVEVGNTASDWSAAPEDVAADAQAKADAAALAAKTAAQAYADAQSALAKTQASAYADGIVTDSEARAIAAAQTKADAAKAAAVAAAAADATEKANVAAMYLLPAVAAQCINRDPNFTKAGGVWYIGSNPSGAVLNLNYSTAAPGAVASTCVYPSNPAGTGNAEIWFWDDLMYPLDPSKVYEQSASIFTDAGNTRVFYLAVVFYDKSGNYLDTVGYGNWGGGWSGYPVLSVTPVGGQFTRYSGRFGPGTGKLIPPNATQCRVGIILNYGASGPSGARMAAQALKLTDVTASTTATWNGVVATSGKLTNTTDISNNLGTYTSPGTARTVINDYGIQVYDGNNRLRIKIGQL